MGTLGDLSQIIYLRMGCLPTDIVPSFTLDSKISWMNVRRALGDTRSHVTSEDQQTISAFVNSLATCLPGSLPPSHYDLNSHHPHHLDTSSNTCTITVIPMTTHQFLYLLKFEEDKVTQDATLLAVDDASYATQALRRRYLSSTEAIQEFIKSGMRFFLLSSSLPNPSLHSPISLGY